MSGQLDLLGLIAEAEPDRCPVCGASDVCSVCGTEVRLVPDREGRDWVPVARVTEVRRSATPLIGYLGPPMFMEFEVTEGAAVADNRVPPLDPCVRAGMVDTIGEARTAEWERWHYGLGVPAEPCWFAWMHCHTARRDCDCAVQIPVPECCGWPAFRSPKGWVCRVDSGHAVDLGGAR